ncbi:F-box protein At3g07870-like [Papaver somniferum]|uniref:F-box protein At3g07870-like n=1 Tax=Papaver somniferum TaxID=3469 RepID=UPI000E6F63D3|nr:F-box protein At3g07870-like [Papaver somniferum]XP_026420806.1 F-box protein At3g07870-like [Papaver somniferum]
MGKFNHLPTEVVLDILTRLPTESVLECKLVCKPWRNLVSHHPSFSQIHLSHLNQSADSDGKLGFLVLNENKGFYYFEYDADETPTGRIRRINLTPPIAYVGGYKVFGSFNGFVCLCEYRYGTVCICNPLTKEYVELPEIIRDWGSDRYVPPWTRGFGYLPSTNEYKVVEIYRLRTDLNIVEVLMFTVGSGNGWRNVGRFEIQSGEAYVEDGVFLNGALHFVEIDEGRVFVFDLIEEKFCEHVSPPPRPPGSTSYEYFSIGVFGGVLYYAIRYYCRNILHTCYDIWPLKGLA